MTTYNRDWEREALNWAAWARSGEDVYAAEIASPFFELVPPPGRATLEVGCGEGRVSRDLKKRGHRVTAIDASPTLRRLAEEADPDSTYLLADSADLPFEDGSFDLVIAFNSLMDVQDLPGSIAEAARVLEPGGRFCVCVTHPLRDAGRFVPPGPRSPFHVTESYFERRRFVGTFERAGISMTFKGWCYPLTAYTDALEAAGFVLEALREPPDLSHDWMPNFLLWRARKR